MLGRSGQVSIASPDDGPHRVHARHVRVHCTHPRPVRGAGPRAGARHDRGWQTARDFAAPPTVLVDLHACPPRTGTNKLYSPSQKKKKTLGSILGFRAESNSSTRAPLGSISAACWTTHSWLELLLLLLLSMCELMDVITVGCG